MSNNNEIEPFIEDEELNLTTEELKQLAQLERELSKEEDINSTSVSISPPSSEDTMTYGELYSSLLVSEELILTILPEYEEKIKQGLKNYKAKQVIKQKKQSIPVDESFLAFYTTKSVETEGAVDLKVVLTQKSGFPILGVRIPDNEF